MSLGSGTHWRGPLLGADTTGIFEDVAAGEFSKARSDFTVWYEEFDEVVADGALAAAYGFTLSNINTATSPTETVTVENGYLLLNPGTKNDSGSQLQQLAAVSGGAITNAGLMPFITSTATLMDNRSLFWECRFSPISDTTAWDGKALLGLFVTDTTLMSNTTGLPTVVTGGGAGFHIAETGELTFVCTNAAIVAAGQATGIDYTLLTTAAVASDWHRVGFRIDFGDANTGVGVAQAYLDGLPSGNPILSVLPFDSTEVYSNSFAYHNGPARDSDLAIDYVISGLSRTGA